MLTKLFISGKNWKLSLAEITAYLNARGVKFKVHFFSREFFALDIEQDVDLAIDDLGGTIKIGLAKAEFPTQTVKQAFLERNKQAQSQIAASLISSGLVDEIAKTTGKVLFGVSVYCTENALHPHSGAIQRFIGSTVKDELARHGNKSNFMGFSKERKLAQLSHVEVLKKKLVENQRRSTGVHRQE